MTIYLNDIKHYPANSSFLKSGAKTMSFYPAAFILFCYYSNLGLTTEFLHINGRILPYLYISGLFPGIFFTSIILILSTQKKPLLFNFNICGLVQ